MNNDTLRPLPNYCLVTIPERYHAPKGPRSPDGLALTVLSGEDAMHELETQIKRGGQLQIETETDRSIRNLVRVGQVLQIPPSLNDQMYLCAAGEGYRTYADITPVVEVGDTVYLDHSCLTDENEILPGIYRVPYAAVICVINNHEIKEMTSDPQGDSFFKELVGHICYGIKPTSPPISKDNPYQSPKTIRTETATLLPVGGYVLLTRVWAVDVVDEPGEFGLVKCRKNAAGLITETSVPPLDTEGEVAFVDAPLKGALNELHPGQRVVFSAGHALIEDICGESYLVIRHDYILAVKKPMNLTPWRECEGLKEFAQQNPFSGEVIDASIAKTVKDIKHNTFAVNIDGKELTCDMDRVRQGLAHREAVSANLPTFLANQNPFTKEFQRLPLNLPTNDA